MKNAHWIVKIRNLFSDRYISFYNIRNKKWNDNLFHGEN